MAEFLTSHVLENEIVKANDFEFAFENLVTNVSKATQMFLESNQDFVINGKVLANTTPDMFVRISPIFGVCKSTGVPFGNTELETLSIGFGESNSGRVDTLEVKGEWEEYDEQQRAFNDPDTDTQTYQYVNTKKRLKPVYRILQGSEGSSVAPDAESDWVKLAEVVIRANATWIEDSDIKNITSDIAGLANEGWTNQEDATYNIGYISDVNERFREQHNEDGTHKENVINSDSLNIGIGSKQINGSILPVGGNVAFPTQTIPATNSILSVLSAITTMLTSLYNAYLKFGNYNFNGELAISSIADANNALTKPLKLVAAGDGTAVLKIGDNPVLSIGADGKLSTNGYTANSNNNLVTFAVTKSLGDLITNNYNDLSGQITDLRATLNGVKEFANDILSRYTLSNVVISAVSTANVTLSGTQTIDGVSLSAGNNVLLKDQNNKAENGVWEVQTGAWNRTSGFTVASGFKDKLFTTTSGTANGGKIFYSPELFDPFTLGTTEIIFKEANFSIRKLGNKIVMRDSNGKAYLDIVGDVTGNVTGNVSGSSGSCTGNAATATSAGKLTTARKTYVTLGTANTSTTRDWSGDTTIPVDGTLNVANGGTGKATHTANAVLTGNGTTAVNNVATASGAFYATAANGAPKFGTLPAAQGGTGQTSLNNVAVGSATKLTTARKVYVKLGTASTTETKDFSGDTAIPVNGTLPVANGGTGATNSQAARQNLGIGYGTCTMAADTVAKKATVSGITISTGVRVAIKFTNKNTAASPTLAVNDTQGYWPIYLRGTAKRPAGGNYETWAAGETVEFVFTGNGWEMQKAINMTLSGTTLYVEY